MPRRTARREVAEEEVARAEPLCGPKSTWKLRAPVARGARGVDADDVLARAERRMAIGLRADCRLQEDELPGARLDSSTLAGQDERG